MLIAGLKTIKGDISVPSAKIADLLHLIGKVFIKNPVHDDGKLIQNSYKSPSFLATLDSILVL